MQMAQELVDNESILLQTLGDCFAQFPDVHIAQNQLKRFVIRAS